VKYFRLNFILCIAGTVLFTASTTLCFAAGRYAPAILSMIPAVISVVLLWRLVHRLISSMSDFMNALDMNDTTIRFAESQDPDINRMSQTMRRIMAIYSSSRLELETRKLYYDRILRIMTHEMRNAITPIVSLSADMKRNPDRYKGEDLNEAVSLISDESQSIRRFLDSYYELTHLPKPEIEAIDVMDFFSGIRRSFAIYLSDKGLDTDIIDYTIPVDMQLQADMDLLGRLVTNVLRNAIDAVASVPSPRIHVDVSVSEGRPYISVEDNGCGIPAEMMPNLFQPFFTTKPGGSGIGLCLSRQIARLHGGDFTITSTPLHSTKALITLA
jgi:Signal transduction histidine kinase